MNGKILRGEIYWVRDALTSGSEEAFKRPFLVVSNNVINEKCGFIVGASITSKPKSETSLWCAKIYALRRESWVMCDHLQEVDQSRLLEYSATCSEAEMADVDVALLWSLGLGGAKKHDVALEQILREVALLKSAFESSAKPTVETVVENVKVLNINAATVPEIVKELAIPEYMAYLIAGYRRENGNFVDIEELRDVPGLPENFVEKYGRKIAIEEIKKNDDQIEKHDDEIKTKVNINTATPEEIRAKTGLGRVACEEIRAYRNKNGPFQGVEELLNLRHFGATCMKRYGAMLEV